MKRELWVIAQSVSNAFSILNAARGEEDNEKPLSQEDFSLIAEKVNSSCSSMMMDSAFDLIELINNRPSGRFCIHSECNYYNMFIPGKCEECRRNEKSKMDESMQIEHFECE